MVLPADEWALLQLFRQQKQGKGENAKGKGKEKGGWKGGGEGWKGKGKGEQKGKGKAKGEKGKGSLKYNQCAICRSEDHWKFECPYQGVECDICGEEHMTSTCRYNVMGKEGGKAGGKGAKGAQKGNANGKGKGATPVAEKQEAQIALPVFCRLCDSSNVPGAYWCIKPGCGGTCMKPKVPGGAQKESDLTKKEKQVMANAEEWAPQEEEEVNRAEGEEGDQEEYEDGEGQNEESGDESEEDKTLQSKVQKLRDTLDDMIETEAPEQAIELTKARLKEMEKKLRVGPLQSIAEIQNARAARERRFQNTQADKERRIEEAQDAIARLRDARKEALERNLRILEENNRVTEAYYEEKTQRSRERIDLLQKNMGTDAEKHKTAMNKLGAKLQAVAETTGEDGEQSRAGERVGNTARDEGAIQGTTLLPGTAFVTSSNLNAATIANEIANNPFLSQANPQMQQAFIDAFTGMLNKCAILSQPSQASTPQVIALSPRGKTSKDVAMSSGAKKEKDKAKAANDSILADIAEAYADASQSEESSDEESSTTDRQPQFGKKKKLNKKQRAALQKQQAAAETAKQQLEAQGQGRVEKPL